MKLKLTMINDIGQIDKKTVNSHIPNEAKSNIKLIIPKSKKLCQITI